jgi:putative ABC transport system substrate-binding protein
MVGVGDPAGAGLVTSLSHPGGNVTGPSELATALSAKRLELVKISFPSITRAAVLVNPDNPFTLLALKETEEASHALGLALLPVEARQAGDLPAAVERARREQAGALLVLPDNITNSNGELIAELAARQRLPTMYSLSEYMGGGLMAYGVSRADTGRRAAIYADRILRGARPSELPVEQPTTLHFVVNLKTARALGFAIPPAVMIQATDAIQ